MRTFVALGYPLFLVSLQSLVLELRSDVIANVEVGI